MLVCVLLFRTSLCLVVFAPSRWKHWNSSSCDFLRRKVKQQCFLYWCCVYCAYKVQKWEFLNTVLYCLWCFAQFSHTHLFLYFVVQYLRCRHHYSGKTKRSLQLVNVSIFIILYFVIAFKTKYLESEMSRPVCVTAS